MEDFPNFNENCRELKPYVCEQMNIRIASWFSFSAKTARTLAPPETAAIVSPGAEVWRRVPLSQKMDSVTRYILTISCV